MVLRMLLVIVTIMKKQNNKDKESKKNPKNNFRVGYPDIPTSLAYLQRGVGDIPPLQGSRFVVLVYSLLRNFLFI